jgi:hypothetical protein
MDLMDRHAKVLLILDDYFVKISKTIEKKFHLIWMLIIMKAHLEYFL